MRTTWHGTALAAAVAAALLAGCGTTDKGSTVYSSGLSDRIVLSGANEVPPVTTGASGSASVTVRTDCSVVVSVKVTGMTPTAAHIHQGAKGANGPVIVPLVKIGEEGFGAPAGSRMSEEQCKAYRSGGTYINVHSAAHPSGEIRGQLPGG